MARQGKIKYYVNDRRDLPLRNHQLAATDDDISGTFTFLRSFINDDTLTALSPYLFPHFYSFHLSHSLTLVVSITVLLPCFGSISAHLPWQQ